MRNMINTRTKKKRLGKNIGKTKNLKRRLRHKISKKKGGKLMGEGSYGRVFKPRFPCVGEDSLTENTEVSKLFKNNEVAKEEFKASQSLNHEFGNTTVVEDDKKGLFINNINPVLAKYFILPYRLCDVNKKLLNTTDAQKKLGITVNDLPTNLKPSWVSSCFRGLCTTPPPVPMLISEGGDYDLFDYLNKNSDPTIDFTIIDFLKFVKHLFNILKGIQLLHTKNLFHGDIKLENIVFVGKDTANETFKFIDLGSILKIDGITQTYESVDDIKKTRQNKFKSNQSEGLLFIAERASELLNIETSPMIIFANLHIIKSNGKPKPVITDTIKNINWSKFEETVNAFNGRCFWGLTPNNLIIKNQYLYEKLINQKLYGLPFTKGSKGIISITKYDETEFDKFITPFLTASIINEKDKLFKSIDLYAFGVIILELLLSFFIRKSAIELLNVPGTTSGANTSKGEAWKDSGTIKKVIDDLHKIVEMCCLYKTDAVVSADQVVTEYKKIVQYVDTIIPNNSASKDSI